MTARRLIAIMITSLSVMVPAAHAQEKTIPASLSDMTTDSTAMDGEVPSKEGPRVRIPIEILPFHSIAKRDPQGRAYTEAVRGELVRQTLRSRLERPNHFYFPGWHVVTEPQRWEASTRKYEVKISLFRRSGAYGEVEDLVGQTRAKGTLRDESRGVFLMSGLSKATFKDKRGVNIAELAIGDDGELTISRR